MKIYKIPESYGGKPTFIINNEWIANDCILFHFKDFHRICIRHNVSLENMLAVSNLIYYEKTETAYLIGLDELADSLNVRLKYEFCMEIEDCKEIWSTIEDDEYKYIYCRDFKDRPELWSTIQNDKYKYLYCRYIEDREELWSTITDDKYKYLYCRDILDREELWSTITDDGNKYR